MTWLYASAILLGSCLLFLVQPMCAKMLLPLLGGTPAVWNTCMVFFQAGLLAGYAYAHALPARLGVGRHALVHLVALVLVYFLLPIQLPDVIPDGWHPVLWLLASLTLSAGLPFVLLAAGAPLVQRWYVARTPSPPAPLPEGEGGKDPYFLYAASNLGSFLALALFPFVIEPYLSLSEQGELWKFGYLALTALLAFCVPLRAMTSSTTKPTPSTPAPTWPQRGRWIVLALIPSSLLLSVTAHLTTDIAAIPLLWLIPMGLYLLTFTIVFAQRNLVSANLLKRWLPLVVIVVLLVKLSEASEPIWLVLGVALVGFTWFALVCHGELARSRPSAQYLTDFYLCLALGGVLGGVLNALIAPLIFSSFAEYPLMIVLACAFGLDQGTRTTRVDWIVAGILGIVTALAILAIQADPVILTDLGARGNTLLIGLPFVFCYIVHKQAARFALGLGAVIGAASLVHGPTGERIYTTRSYYGVHRVTKKDGFHCLIHGNTIHGQQDPEDPSEPLTYYSRTGPIGDVFRAYRGDARLNKVALVGLGTGSLAAYAEPGLEFTFFEIDPTVQRIAENPKFFTFLNDAPKGTIRIEIGDARLQLKKSKETFGLIVIDAFGSDSIPLHLLTREAMTIYLEHLEPNGLIAFHVSNNYVDLEPAIANLAADVDPPMSALIRRHRVLTDKEKRQGKMPSDWIVVARTAIPLVPLGLRGGWETARTQPRQRVWTDDFSNLWQVFRWRRVD